MGKKRIKSVSVAMELLEAGAEIEINNGAGYTLFIDPGCFGPARYYESRRLPSSIFREIEPKLVKIANYTWGLNPICIYTTEDKPQ